MVFLDGFTQLHLFHGLLDNEVYFYNEKSLAIKLHCQKEFTELLLKGGHLWPAAQNRQSSTESPNVFPLRIQMYCNLNNVRIVHYQIFDVRKEAVVQTSILLHVHGSFKVFLESSKGGKSMLRSLQWNAQLIANPI